MLYRKRTYLQGLVDLWLGELRRASGRGPANNYDRTVSGIYFEDSASHCVVLFWQVALEVITFAIVTERREVVSGG